MSDSELSRRDFIKVTTGIVGGLIGLAIGLDLIGRGAWVIAPPFIAVGTASSALLGWFAERFSRSSRWLASMRRA